MTRHILRGRALGEALCWQRRGFLHAAATWTALGGFAAAHAQQRSNIVDFRGDATVNGQRLTRDRTIQTGDSLETGPDSHLVFVIGDSSFQVRPNSRLTVERGASLFAVSVLRLLAGAVAAAWGKGPARQIVMPTLTAGIRGTGTYAEVFEAQDLRSYFCNCYGTVDVSAGPDKVVSQSSYHQSFWGEARPKKNGRLLMAANAINHTDEEIDFLARLVGQQTAWQAAGRKGVHNGLGYMDPEPPSVHPANQIK
jgi:hypothetical protein